MYYKTINLEIEVNEKVAFFVENIARIKQISTNDAYMQMINVEIKKGAKTLSEALHLGILEHKDEIEKICQYIKLQEIANAPIKPANEVEKALEKNVEMCRDDELINKITEQVIKGKK